MAFGRSLEISSRLVIIFRYHQKASDDLASFLDNISDDRSNFLQLSSGIFRRSNFPQNAAFYPY